MVQAANDSQPDRLRARDANQTFPAELRSLRGHYPRWAQRCKYKELVRESRVEEWQREGLMKKAITASALGFALLTSQAAIAAQPVQETATLAPGKPAGVKNAALHAPLWVWVAGIGFIALGVALATSSGSGSSGSTSSTHL